MQIEPVRNGAGRLSTVLAAAAVAIAANGSAPVAAQDAFAVGMVPSDITSLGPRLADAAGAYAKYNIKPELVTIEGGSRGVQVLLSGKIQAMQVGFSVAVTANQQGADVRLVTSSSNVMPMSIYAVPSVKSPADLKGQKIAISAFTSETDMAVGLALRQWNMTRREVVVTPLGGASQRLAAQLSGQVLASPYVSPGTITAHEKGLVEMLDLSNAGAPWVFNGLVMNHDFERKNIDLLKRFIKANVEGVYKALADESFGKAVIAKEFKTDNPVIIDDAYATLKRVYPRDFTPSAQAVANVIAETKALGKNVTITKPADHVDTTAVDALRNEGFFDQMQKTYGL
jgi:NitT/TauT family transport system substrate-binding protein